MKKKILALVAVTLSALAVVGAFGYSNTYAEAIDPCASYKDSPGESECRKRIVCSLSAPTVSGISNEECASKIGRGGYCKKGGDASECVSKELKSKIECSSKKCNQTYYKNRVNAIAKIIVSYKGDLSDPCSSYDKNSTAYTECQKGDTNKAFYYNATYDEDGKQGSVETTTDPTSFMSSKWTSGRSGSNTSGDKSGALAPGEQSSDCAAILPDSWCNGSDGSGIAGILNTIITIMTGAVVTAGTIGIIICGFLWMTARDNEQQLATAKRRMRDVVIGIIAWVLIAVLANLFIPKNTNEINQVKSGNASLGQ